MANGSRIITVFGGSGFIGRHLVNRLARLDGTIIRIACRHPSQASFLRTAGEGGQIVPFPTDIFSDDSVAAAVAGADTVINLIGILYQSGRWTFDAVQAEAPERMARAAKMAGVRRLIQVSAIGADLASPAAYARTKALGEQRVLAAFPEATILRPSIVFGAEDGFFNRFAGMARLSPFLPLIGGGKTKFQPVYVGDVAEAILAALRDPQTQGRTYELGGPGVYSFRRLMEILLAEIRRCRLLLPLPWWLAKLQARVFECLPTPPLTRDQVELLKTDNVVSAGARTLHDLGITPTALEVILPSYLARYRPANRQHTLVGRVS